MPFDPIIRSMLDNDLYKVTMGCAVAKKYPRTMVRYDFINRGQTKFPEGFARELRLQVEEMRELKLTKDELQFLASRCGDFLDPFFLDFFAGFRYKPDEVHIHQDDDGELTVNIVGPWYRTIYWEVVLMAIISELYFKMEGKPLMREGQGLSVDRAHDTAMMKALNLSEAGCLFADFGTRRRYSYQVHDDTVRALKSYSGCVGTSNMHFAHKYGLKPIGTQAHEWFMVHAAKYGYRHANSESLGKWADVYNGNLGVALTDTFTTDAFFKAFDTFHANLFQGVRHDSGDAIEFGHKVIAHYQKLGIDPMAKTIVFSDGLDTDTAIKINNTFKGKIKVSFGIGTHFTNDVGVKPLNMVIKVVQAHIDGRWVPTVKLSDNPGKHTGDTAEIEAAQHMLGL